MTDEDLMDAVSGGDVERLGELFDRHHRRLFGVLLHLTGDRHLSEDLVQETFVRILKYRRSWRRGHRFAPWMFQIARNARIDHERKNPGLETGAESRVASFPCSRPSPDESLRDREDARLLVQALARLSVQYREVLLLRGTQGMKFDEIASVLSCPVGTVKARASRAIRELRAALSQGRRGKEGRDDEMR